MYRAHSPANWIFAVSEGAVKCYRELPSGKNELAAFIFPQNLFGLAENGRYVNSARAITWSTIHSLPFDELTQIVKRDAEFAVSLSDRRATTNCANHSVGAFCSNDGMQRGGLRCFSCRCATGCKRWSTTGTMFRCP